VRTYSEMTGDLVPLVSVAEAMARHAATGYGRQSFHRPTFDNVLQQRIALLLGAARTGELSVLDAAGLPIEPGILGVDGAVDAGQVPFALLRLCASKRHLEQWGEARGDKFLFADAKPQLVEFDLRDASGRVLVKDYYRGYVGTAGAASSLPSTQVEPDPQRRLARLRALGGSAKFRQGKWRFTKIGELVAEEERAGRKRSDQKTVHGDLCDAADAEAADKRRGHFDV
jgi:hypothetical protein